ncbi:MAG: hypothetical protein ACK5RG_05755 [Cyclobacteriaceae bacterium]|jgi:hypothetical protein
MKKYLFLFLVFFSCTGKNDLLVKTITSTPTGRDSTVTAYKDNYLEIRLSVFDNGTWEASHKISSKYNSASDFYFKGFSLCDENGKTLRFKESTEFLNHASSCGFELVKESKTFDGLAIEYTFKKK